LFVLVSGYVCEIKLGKYSAFESMLTSSIVSYRIELLRNKLSTVTATNDDIANPYAFPYPQQ